MKISKLFHWLYAFIMLMPVFFIAGRVAYVTFNKNAKDSYTGIINYDMTLSLNEFKNKNAIAIQNYTLNEQTTYYYEFPIFKDYFYTFNRDNFGTNNRTAYGFNVSTITFESDNNNIYTYTNSFVCFSRDRNENNGVIQIFENNFFNQSNCTLTKAYDAHAVYKKDGVVQTFTHRINVKTTYHFNGRDNYLYLTASNEPQSVLSTILTNLTFSVDSLDNAFEYSVNQLNEVPIFSWAQTSFLVAPFSYITGLFGIASTSPVNTLLSYWLSISIIWLVFDLVMYLPLLIHRWLDKGVLE